jgi:hypothetical protein
MPTSISCGVEIATSGATARRAGRLLSRRARGTVKITTVWSRKRAGSLVSQEPGELSAEATTLFKSANGWKLCL